MKMQDRYRNLPARTELELITDFLNCSGIYVSKDIRLNLFLMPQHIGPSCLRLSTIMKSTPTIEPKYHTGILNNVNDKGEALNPPVKHSDSYRFMESSKISSGSDVTY
jgi:hypothetical protein